MWFVVRRFSHTNLKRKLCYQVLCAQSSQICIKRKRNWYFIVKLEEGNTWEHAEEDRLGLSPEPAPDLFINKNMLCGVQLTWHDGVKQRAATDSHTSLGRDTHHSVRTLLLPRTLTVRTMWQHCREQYIKKSWFSLHQVPTLKPLRVTFMQSSIFST